MSAEEIRQQKLQELQEKQDEAATQHHAMQKQIEMIEGIARQHMTQEALSRYGNLRIAHPEKAVQVAAFIAQAAQKGLREKISDAQLKELLIRMQEPSRKTRINIR